MNEILQQTHEMIDNLKAICTNYGLGNTGNEYKIITEIFLYKFLNDKFFYKLKKNSPAFKSKTTRDIEKLLDEMSDDEFESQTLYLSPHTAIIKPNQFISYLFNRHATQDFHKLFDIHLTAFLKRTKTFSASRRARVLLSNSLSRSQTTSFNRRDVTNFVRQLSPSLPM